MAAQPAHSCQADEPGSAVLVGSGGNFWSALVRLPGESWRDMCGCEKQAVSVNTPMQQNKWLPGQNPTTSRALFPKLTPSNQPTLHNWTNMLISRCPPGYYCSGIILVSSCSPGLQLPFCCCPLICAMTVSVVAVQVASTGGEADGIHSSACC